MYYRNCRFLVNIIPIIRNEHSWPEYIIAALVTGTLGGHLFCDRIALGFEEKKITGRLTYRQLCLAKGIGFGLLFGILTATYSNVTGSHANTMDLRKWEKYWNQRRQVMNRVELFLHKLNVLTNSILRLLFFSEKRGHVRLKILLMRNNKDRSK